MFIAIIIHSMLKLSIICLYAEIIYPIYYLSDICRTQSWPTFSVSFVSLSLSLYIYIYAYTLYTLYTYIYIYTLYTYTLYIYIYIQYIYIYNLLVISYLSWPTFSVSFVSLTFVHYVLVLVTKLVNLLLVLI